MPKAPYLEAFFNVFHKVIGQHFFLSFLSTPKVKRVSWTFQIVSTTLISFVTWWFQLLAHHFVVRHYFLFKRLTLSIELQLKQHQQHHMWYKGEWEEGKKVPRNLNSATINIQLHFKRKIQFAQKQKKFLSFLVVVNLCRHL